MKKIMIITTITLLCNSLMAFQYAGEGGCWDPEALNYNRNTDYFDISKCEYIVNNWPNNEEQWIEDSYDMVFIEQTDIEERINELFIIAYNGKELNQSGFQFFENN